MRLPPHPRPPAIPARAWVVIALLLVLLPIGDAPHAQERELHWRELAVEANLDAEGRLHVRERQVMVFTGAWNGGERSFRLEPGQRLQLHSMSRIENGGRAVLLTQGALDRVDRYAWHGERTLRWRSRRPQDPPFANTELTYVLDYTISDFLVPDNEGQFLLAHDFAFTDRRGDIERFTLDLTLDPAWTARAQDFAGHVEAGPLRPGQGYVVRLPLGYTGAAGRVGHQRPASVLYGAPWSLRTALGLALLIAVVFETVCFVRRERTFGRFLPIERSSQIDQAWLDTHVFQLKPEVVGAAYDHTTSAPEVAAVIARLVTEGKIKSRLEKKSKWLGSRDVLHLELLVDEKELLGYEAALVKPLFFGQRTTDTDQIKAHYEKTGFDPAGKIRAPLKSAVKKALGPDLKSAGLALRPPFLLLAIGIAGMVAAALRRRAESQIVAPAIILGVLSAIFLGLLAYHVRRRAVRPGGALVCLILGLAGIVWWSVFLVALAPFKPSALLVVSGAIFCFGLCRFILTLAKTRERPEAIALRRDLAAAREFFAIELQKRDPQLQDAWVPYLIALGLASDMDRWFRAFGGASAGGAVAGSFGSSNSGWSGGTSSGHGWSGGGGAFGGAGASGSWASAMGTMAAGVPSPSSSGSGGGGGGGGGGGSSSGGGGGGGW